MKRLVGIRYFFVPLILALLVSSCGDSSSGSPATSPTTPPACQLKYVYDHVVNGGEVQEVVDREVDQNNTSERVTIMLTATKSQTVGISRSDISIQRFNAQLNLTGVAITPEAMVIGQAQAVYESVHEINNSVVMTRTAAIGNTTPVNVGPWSQGYGNYGVYAQVVSGHLYSQNCPKQHVDLGDVLTFTPIRVGWCTWVRGPNVFADNGQPPCPAISAPPSNG